VNPLVERLIASGLMRRPPSAAPELASLVKRRNYPVITNRCRRCGRIKGHRHNLICRVKHMRKR